MNLATLKAAVAPAAILNAVSKAEVGERGGASERDGRTKCAIVASNLKKINLNILNLRDLSFIKQERDCWWSEGMGLGE